MARNPFIRPARDTDPRPAGLDGKPVDYVRWYPPDTPFLWGQAFGIPLNDVPRLNGGQWPNQPLPGSQWEVPFGVDEIAHMFPGAVGTAGQYQEQLLGMGTAGVAGPVQAEAMDDFGMAKSAHAGGVGLFRGFGAT